MISKILPVRFQTELGQTLSMTVLFRGKLSGFHLILMTTIGLIFIHEIQERM